jgi:hypothetical protein
VNAIMSQVVLWGSIKLYSDKMKFGEALGYETENVSEDQLTAEYLYSIGQSISSIWVVSVVCFFIACKKEFVGTFVGKATARSYAKDSWDWQMVQEPRVTDEAIVKVFRKHHDCYRHFEDEIGAFLSENWERWNYEKPKFFTMKFVASIPLSVLSQEILSEVTKNGASNNNTNLQEEGRAKTGESFIKSRKSLEVTSKWKGGVGKIIGSNYVTGNYKTSNKEIEEEDWVIDDIDSVTLGREND